MWLLLTWIPVPNAELSVNFHISSKQIIVRKEWTLRFSSDGRKILGEIILHALMSFFVPTKMFTQTLPSFYHNNFIWNNKFSKTTSSVRSPFKERLLGNKCLYSISKTYYSDDLIELELGEVLQKGVKQDERYEKPKKQTHITSNFRLTIKHHSYTCSIYNLF